MTVWDPTPMGARKTSAVTPVIACVCACLVSCCGVDDMKRKAAPPVATTISIRPDPWLWGVEWPASGVAARHMTASVTIDGKRHALKSGSVEAQQTVKTPLGACVARRVSFPAGESPCCVTLTIAQDTKRGVVTVRARVTNESETAVALGDVELADGAVCDVGASGASARALVGMSHPEVAPVLGV